MEPLIFDYKHPERISSLHQHFSSEIHELIMTSRKFTKMTSRLHENSRTDHDVTKIHENDFTKIHENQY